VVHFVRLGTSRTGRSGALVPRLISVGSPARIRRSVTGRVLKPTPPCSLYVADGVMRPVSEGGATLVPD
jgi:hypothetical protein